MFQSLRFLRTFARALPLTILVLAALTAVPAGASPQSPGPAAPPAAQEEKQGVERNAAMETFLQFLNKSPEDTLRKHPGLTGPVVDAIMANRAAGKSYASVRDFRQMTDIDSMNFEKAFRPFYEADLKKTTLASTRKPVQPVTPPAPGKPGTPGAAPPSPAPDPTQGPIGAVRAGYYAELEGYESWDGVDPAVKKEFFETINRERCTCGCTNETLAWCYVNDKTCPVVRPRVKKIYDDLMKRVAANPPAAPSAPR